MLTWISDGVGGEVHIRGRVTPGPAPPFRRSFRSFSGLPRWSNSAHRTLRYDTVGESPSTYSGKRPDPAYYAFRFRRSLGGTRSGLVDRPGRLEGSPLSVERFPPELMRIGSPPLRRTILYRERSVLERPGVPGDFFSIRTAAPTDTPRQINWRATARRGRLLANEFYLERTGDVLLLLDLRPSPLGPERDSPLVSLAAAAAYGIAEAFLDEKARVGLAFFDEFVTALPLASGRTQRYRIREALRRAHPGNFGGARGAMRDQLTSLLPPGRDDDPPFSVSGRGGGESHSAPAAPRIPGHRAQSEPAAHSLRAGRPLRADRSDRGASDAARPPESDRRGLAGCPRRRLGQLLVADGVRRFDERAGASSRNSMSVSASSPSRTPRPTYRRIPSSLLLALGAFALGSQSSFGLVFGIALAVGDGGDRNVSPPSRRRLPALWARAPPRGSRDRERLDADLSPDRAVGRRGPGYSTSSGWRMMLPPLPNRPAMSPRRLRSRLSPSESP